MSFNVAMLKAMQAEGLDLDACIRVAEAMEGGPRPTPVPVKPEDARPRRLTSSGKRKVYDTLANRDDETCVHCGCDAVTLWRRMGIYSTEEGWSYTKVHPTSNLEIDHRIPLWAGGDNSLENLWLLCIECHKKKTAQEASQRRRA